MTKIKAAASLPRPATAERMNMEEHNETTTRTKTELDVAAIKQEAASMVAACIRGQHSNNRVIRLCIEVEKLSRFKAYVHKRLDDAGIPADPESPHKAEGCRIGGRLDIALRRAAAATELLDQLKYMADAYKRLMLDKHYSEDTLLTGRRSRLSRMLATGRQIREEIRRTCGS